MRSFLLAAATCALLIGCDKGLQTSAPIRSDQIQLKEVSNGTCLNLQSYLNTLHSLSPRLAVRRLTTDVAARPAAENHLSPNFMVRTAYANFSIDDTTLSELKDLPRAQQIDCEKVTLTHGQGFEEYKVTKKSDRQIVLENDWDHQIIFEWTSPNTMIIRDTFAQGDYLCDSHSKAWITVTKELTWGRGRTTHGDVIESSRISDPFLTLLSEATGYPKENLYLSPEDTSPPPRLIGGLMEVAEPTPAPEPQPGAEMEPGANPEPGAETEPGTLAISIEKLKELKAQPMKPQFLSCGN